MSARLAALAASLDGPLLVTDLVNIDYLTGLRELERRAARAAGRRGVALHGLPLHRVGATRCADVEVVLAKRSLLVELGGKLKGTVQFEAAALPYSEWQNLTAGSAEARPDDRRRRAFPRRQGRGRARGDPPGGAHRRPRVRGTHGRDVRRPQRARARLAAARAGPRARRRRRLVRGDRRVGAERRAAARDADRQDRRAAHARRRRLGRQGRRLLLGLHADAVDRLAAGAPRRGLQRLPRRPAEGVSRGFGPASPASRPTRSPATRSLPPASARTSATVSATASGIAVHEAPRLST